jgi:glycyl-tRNA synthetase beta chain
MDRLDTLLFHAKIGSYREKTDRIAALAERIAGDVLKRPESAADAAQAARLAKADLTTGMVGEFPELQGTMGGIYARDESKPEAVWKAVYYHYLPIGVEPNAPPTRSELGSAAVTWAAVSLADKADTLWRMFSVGEEPTGSRDPLGLRRQAQGLLRLLVDLPELTGVQEAVSLADVLGSPGDAPGDDRLAAFLVDRLKHLYAQRGYRYDEINAVLRIRPSSSLRPLDVRRRLEALQSMRDSEDFAALAVLFKRVKNIAREAAAGQEGGGEPALVEPAERALLDALAALEPSVHGAVKGGDYRGALQHIATLRPVVDRFFVDVLVMAEDPGLRAARLSLMVRLRDLILDIADISEIVSAEP